MTLTSWDVSEVERRAREEYRNSHKYMTLEEFRTLKELGKLDDGCFYFLKRED